MRKHFFYLFILFVSAGVSAQVGINTASPNPSAALDVTSTTNDKGFLPPRLTTAQRDSIATPAAGLTIYNTSVNCLQWYNGTYWYDGCETSILISKYPTGSVFCASGPTAIVNVTNPTTGKTWMDRNLGAGSAATSSTDANSYGDLYQWGRRSDGHQCRTSANTVLNATVSTDTPPHGNFIIVNTGNFDWRSPQNVNLWQGVNGINNPCPSGYRLPTETELNNERLSWVQPPISSTNNATGAFASPLKLPIAGLRNNSNGSLLNVGTNGYYWSSTVSSTNARSLAILSSTAGIGTSGRAFGISVRCLKD
jgi:uncharacterized protein (TIGR02145 family)